MSDAVKVGDQFKLPVYVGDRGAIVQSDGERIDYLKLDLMVSCIAINSYDRLQQENAELRSILAKSIAVINELNQGYNEDVKACDLVGEIVDMLNKND
ncbi:hypothetical protein NVP1016O_20 [Vibrio phage 1.016.O._10N.286.46.A11]|nr:hypothetical protein NVP1016O_20 [Vibrio phage 1.016.O._10N.286.46.A11]AUR85249.1 hypothetical protein NVP1071A_19 [Vibrio phage 1.071.A._10N.286.46.A12]